MVAARVDGTAADGGQASQQGNELKVQELVGEDAAPKDV